VACYIVSLPVIDISYLRFRKRVGRERIPLFGVPTATAFALQMVNYPLGPGGTTGHLIGTPMLSILFGPDAAIVGISVVLLVQALIFGDGGITTFGANALNMSVTASLISFASFKLMRKFFKGENNRKEKITE